MAQQLGTKEWLYVEYETEQIEIPKELKAKVKPKKVELCTIARRRADMTQEELGEILGLSRLWVNRMEKGKVPIDRLVEYWGV